MRAWATRPSGQQAGDWKLQCDSTYSRSTTSRRTQQTRGARLGQPLQTEPFIELKALLQARSPGHETVVPTLREQARVGPESSPGWGVAGSPPRAPPGA